MGAILKVVQTKRFMYDVLLARLHALDVYASKSNDVYEDSCIAILGVRQIGKTVLLKQLHNAAPDISEYRDCSELSESFDFEEYLQALTASGVRHLFLDEVCKIHRDMVADLVSFIKMPVPL